ncbi:MAG: TIR domain-containing protein [Deltaproteobacteria bacterium]|nr:TIR domain-containing protein [Deltaproteobacteria bacterium]
MNLFDSIKIGDLKGQKLIELYQGDLTKLSPEDHVDILVVSAFPKDYSPVPGSLIGALHWKGVSVDELADDRAIDLRKHFSCWLSQEIKAKNKGIEFDRILCFEPYYRGKPPEVVGDIFRALSPILADMGGANSVALPIVAAGSQGYSVADVLPPLLDASIKWLSLGYPIKKLKIVSYSDEDTDHAKQIFDRIKKEKGFQNEVVEYQYDFFISYAHENVEEMEIIRKNISDLNNEINFFLDRQEIKIGQSWQIEVFKALDNCKKVISLYSPSYLDSKICQEEFNMAWLRGRNRNENTLIPIYIQNANLPTYMSSLNYIDCRESDEKKIINACSQIVKDL